MFNSFVDFMQAFMRSQSSNGAPSNDVTARLMELADAAAGYDPSHALELRRAAMATLAVIR
ncbi:MAG: hypothetical protein WBC18_24680 [Ottowia sp.]|uniref:hypothetical protein n=1 Tax=unclassified Ottowia TaxID=2645081 RepID=UPI003C2F4B60